MNLSLKLRNIILTERSIFLIHKEELEEICREEIEEKDLKSNMLDSEDRKDLLELLGKTCNSKKEADMLIKAFNDKIDKKHAKSII